MKQTLYAWASIVVGCTILVVWKRKKLSSGGETAHS